MCPQNENPEARCYAWVASPHRSPPGGYRVAQQRSRTQTEAGSDPPGHLWVTWGVYLCAGKPPLADIILSHPPDLT